MSEPFVESFRVRWADMDFNQHMRNAAYLGAAEDTRMRFLEKNGWTMKEFVARRLGPVVVEDKLTYKRELGLLEGFRVDLRVAAIAEDGRKMKVQNRVVREKDGELAAIVESVIVWFDLAARKPIAPPPELRDLWLGTARTESFESW